MLVGSSKKARINGLFRHGLFFLKGHDLRLVLRLYISVPNLASAERKEIRWPCAPEPFCRYEELNAAAEVRGILRALANERRLMILCKLVEWGEANVTTLAEAVGLSQSALSQHLARMRDEGIVTYRRESQTLWYRIADPRIELILAQLQNLYCRD